MSGGHLECLWKVCVWNWLKIYECRVVTDPGSGSQGPVRVCDVCVDCMEYVLGITLSISHSLFLSVLFSILACYFSFRHVTDLGSSFSCCCCYRLHSSLSRSCSSFLRYRFRCVVRSVFVVVLVVVCIRSVSSARVRSPLFIVSV